MTGLRTEPGSLDMKSYDEDLPVHIGKKIRDFMRR